MDNVVAGAASAQRGRFSAWPTWAWAAPEGPTLRGRRRLPEAGAPDLHWLSGNGFCGGVYAPLLEALPAAWGLMTHDIAGHGASDPATAFDGVATTLARVRGALDAQPVRPRVLIGHSFGAALSLRLAARQPRDFDALILLDPIMLPTWFWLSTKASAAVKRHPFAQASRRRRARWDNAERLRAHLAGRGIYAGWSEAAMDAFVTHASRDENGERVLCCAPELEAQIFESPLYLWRDIRRLRLPTLLLYGETSYFFMAPSARAAARRNRRIAVQALPGGHCFMLQDPQTAAATIADRLPALLDRAGT